MMRPPVIHTDEKRRGRRRSHCRCGFTLTELLVAIGILIFLAGLLMAGLVRASRSAERARGMADLQAIASALEAYHADFGYYPPVDEPGTGFAVLGRALIAPGPANLSDTPAYNSSIIYEAGEVVRVGDQEYVALPGGGSAQVAPTGLDNDPFWRPFRYADNHDGPGFRVRAQGRVYGPYLSPDRFRLQGTAILGQSEQPILYFPARHRRDITAGTNYVGNTPGAMFRADDNLAFFHSDPVRALALVRTMLGDYNRDGRIDPNAAVPERPFHTGPYLLWTTGPTRQYAPADNPSTNPAVNRRRVEVIHRDIVANFDAPP